MSTIKCPRCREEIVIYDEIRWNRYKHRMQGAFAVGLFFLLVLLFAKEIP